MRTRDVIAIAGLIGNLVAPQRDTEFKKALAHQDLDTEAPLRYKLIDADFVEHTRVVKLSFVKIKTYRTVERYIQRDHEKFKIYSDWKEKESKVPAITLKLTNNVLENLRDANFLLESGVIKKSDAADLVAEYALDILWKVVTNAEKAYLVPSWMEKAVLAAERTRKINSLKDEEAKYTAAINTSNDKIRQMEAESAKLKSRLQKISKARENKFLFILLSILSLGLYAVVNSEKLLKELAHQLDESEQKNSLEIANLNQGIEQNYAQIKQNDEEINKVKADYAEKINQVLPLGDYIVNNTDFTPLKSLSGITYEKIKGVYVIRNRELDKIYVGQSKDVLKRLKDHFTGTEPKNIIFAEDYYQSKIENRADLFEFKIEALETKDELDKREMELIAEYDAFNNGYNKTAGNV